MGVTQCNVRYYELDPTLPLPAFFGYRMGVLVYLMSVLNYLMSVLGYLMGVLGYTMAWRRWGRRKWRGAPIPGPGPGPRHFLRPKRHLAMAWRRRQAPGYPRSPIRFRERPLDSRERPADG